jgi:hypothetical protein
MMNSSKYIPILPNRMVPELKKVGASENGVFQQDLAPFHASKKDTKFLSEIK